MVLYPREVQADVFGLLNSSSQRFFINTVAFVEVWVVELAAGSQCTSPLRCTELVSLGYL